MWHTALKTCVQQLRHIEIITWLEVLSATGIVRATPLCIRACILSDAAEEAKPAARLHFAVKCALSLLQPADAVVSTLLGTSGPHCCQQAPRTQAQHSTSHSKPCSLSDPDACLCSLLLLQMLTIVLTDAQTACLTASTFRKVFAEVCGHLAHDLEIFSVRNAKASAQHLDVSSELLDASINQIMQYLKKCIKHGAASVCPCVNLLLTLAACVDSTPSKSGIWQCSTR